MYLVWVSIIFIIIILVAVCLFKSKEKMTNVNTLNKAATCLKNGNNWVGKCVPPNLKSIDCVINGNFWVNSACVKPAEFSKQEKVMACINNNDIYYNGVCNTLKNFNANATPK